LAQGKLEGSVVTCPKHGSRFDVTDGHVVRWLKQSGVLSKVGSMVRPERPLMVYKTRVEGGEIMVEI
ncbi:MAG: Rieske 2Fe-2S domain-containing protein, partial [Dehalococcoidia bacterium]